MAFPVMLALAAAQAASQGAKEQRATQLAGDTQRYGFWTGLRAQPVQYADPVGTALQAYGATQAQEQAQKDSDAQNEYLKARTSQINRSAPGGMYDPRDYSAGQPTGEVPALSKGGYAAGSPEYGWDQNSTPAPRPVPNRYQFLRTSGYGGR